MIVSGAPQVTRSLTACVLVVCLGFPGLQAKTHVVSPAELQQELASATQERQRNRDTITAFLSSPAAVKALSTARLDVNRVKVAISSLNDAELTRLAARSAKAQSDFAAGRLSDRDLILILLGIAALILIIVAVD